MLNSPVWRERSRSYFTVGLLLGGLSTAVLAYLAGSLMRPVLPLWARGGLLAAVVLFVMAGELRWHAIELPQRRRLVPTRVIDQGPRQGALRFGYEMGTGMRTFMPSNLPYVALTAVALLAPFWGAVLAGLAFGGGRAWMALGRDPANTSAWDASWKRFERPIRITLSTCAAGAVAVVLWS